MTNREKLREVFPHTFLSFVKMMRGQTQSCARMIGWIVNITREKKARNNETVLQILRQSMRKQYSIL